MARPKDTDSARFLNRAAADGDLTQVKALLETGADVNGCESERGFRPLLSAAEKGQLAVVQHLLAKGAPIDATSAPEHPAPHEGATALGIACAQGHSEVAEALLKAGADANVNAKSARAPTAVEYTASSGNLEMLERLLNSGAVLPDTVLYGPVWPEHVEIVRRLITASANVNAVAANGTPILVRACAKPFRDVNAAAQSEIVQMLLAAGANLEARNDLGATALMTAVQARNRPLALALLASGANARAADQGNFTALHSAVNDEDLELVEALLQAGADMNARDTFGASPLSTAQANRSKEILRSMGVGPAQGKKPRKK